MKQIRLRTVDGRRWLFPLNSLFPLIRFGVFGAAVLASAQLVYLGVQRYGAEWMGRENGPIESAQPILAGVGSLCLFWAASKSRVGRTGFCISASLMGYAAARECDQLFEQWLFDDAYHWLVGLPLAMVAGGILWRHRGQFISDCGLLMRQPSATIFAIAGIYLCTVCQLLDRPALWAEFAHVEAFGPVKSVVEETCELFAYQLLTLAGIESLFLARSLTAIGSQEQWTLTTQIDAKPTNLSFRPAA